MEPNATTESVKGGLIIGLINIIISMIIYAVDVSLMVSLTYMLFSFGLAIFLYSYFGKKYRNDHLDGYISFGEAFKFVFVAGLIGAILNGFFSILLFNFIDPELPEILTEQVILDTESRLESFGVPSEQIDSELEKLESGMPEKFSIGGILKDSWSWLLGAGIIGLICGAIIKKKRPEFE